MGETGGGTPNLEAREFADRSCGLTIHIPDGFTIKSQEASSALDRISKLDVPDLHTIQIEYGAKMTSEVVIPELDPAEIKGVAGNASWSSMRFDRYKPNEIVLFAQKIIKMSDEERHEMVSDIHLYSYTLDGETVYYVGEGQHRTMTIKMLDELGCHVRFTNVWVGVMTH